MATQFLKRSLSRRHKTAAFKPRMKAGRDSVPEGTPGFNPGGTPFVRAMVLAVVTNFILTCAPISYASIYASDSLRIPAAKDRAARQIVRDLGGVKPEADPLVLGITISLLRGAQTGGYNIKHAMDDGANGGIFNHSERRGRLEIAMTNMLRGIRSIGKALEERIEESWTDTLKTENLSDTEITATLEWLRDFQSKTRDEKAIELLARKLVNYVINLQLKEVIAYSGEYSIAQTVLCVGETLSQYEAGRTEGVLKQDLEEILAGITQEQTQKIGLRIAYEPRWAIGTGKTPTAEQIQTTHRFIKDTVKGILGTELDVDYGGSLNEKNCAEILALKDVDGGLIGGAAKVPEKISPVIDEAIKQGEIKGKKLNIGMNWKAEDASTGLSPLDAFVELFRAKDLSRVQVAIGTPNVKLVRDRMTELEKEINAQRKKDVPSEPTPELIQSADTMVYKEFSGGFDNVVKSLKDLEDSRGALVIGANTIFENAGTIATLRKIKEARADLKIAVWAQDEVIVNRLKVMGIEEVADIMSSKGLDGVLSELNRYNIAPERIMLINSGLDLKNINISELLREKPGLKLINVKTPTAGEASLNTMPLIIARAIAGIFQSEGALIEQYTKLSRSYSESGQISAEDLKSLNELTSQITSVPLVKVSEEIAQAQIIYEETVGKI